MQWRPIGKPGDAYPNWIRELKGKSGAYAIRKEGLLWSTVLYVGESHTGGLYKTLTRHFAKWHRDKRWWHSIEAYQPRQTDPGHTYDRGDVQVIVKVTTKADAIAWQAKWIKSLKPRDNVAGVAPAGDDGW